MLSPSTEPQTAAGSNAPRHRKGACLPGKPLTRKSDRKPKASKKHVSHEPVENGNTGIGDEPFSRLDPDARATKPKERRPRISFPRFLRPSIDKDDEIGYFAPKTWAFWRALIICFCAMNLLGHLCEIPYCSAMDALFGIVDDSYPVWTDPWYHPYWVYGVGAVLMTLFIEPFKERLVLRRKTMWGALLQCFLIVVALACAMELVIGLLVNQPDPVTGVYPYWDNSQLPLNVGGQAWLVNDVMIGLVAMIYIWVVYPLVCRLLGWLRPQAANALFGIVVAVFAGCCIASYGQLIATGVLGG